MVSAANLMRTETHESIAMIVGRSTEILSCDQIAGFVTAPSK